MYKCTYHSFYMKERKRMKDKHGNELKRLIVDLNINIHCEIKKRASQKNMTIKAWIEKAIMEQIRKEIDLGWK